MSRTLVINGTPVVEQQPRPPIAQPDPDPVRPRIFDHLDGCPEDRFLSRVARKMRSDPAWKAVPTWNHPETVSGEIDR